MSFVHTPWRLDLENIFAKTHGYLCMLRDLIFTSQTAQRNEQELQRLELQRSRSRTNLRWDSSARVHPVPDVTYGARVPRYVERGWVPPHQTASWYQNGLHY
jgi:hypothetical protein